MISEGKKVARMFNEGRDNVSNEESGAYTSLVKKHLLHNVKERTHSDKHFKMSDLALPFPGISRSLLHEI